MDNIVSILIAILILGVLIMVHEVGHFVAGRLLGFDVYQFAIGFGPKIWQKKKGKTLYSIRALPLGGFCAFDNEASLTRGELEFNKKPIWKRFIVILSGPVMNIALAYVVVVILLAGVGLDVLTPRINVVNPDTPAQVSGLMPGDVFLEANGKTISDDVNILHEVIGESKGEPVQLLIQRGNETLEKTLTPAFVESSNRYMIGIELAITKHRTNFFVALGESFGHTGSMIKELLAFLGRLVTRGEGADQVAGPVGSVGIISEVTRSRDITSIMTMIAFISMNLGVFNLLPIPPLDGSKLILMGVEGIRGKQMTLETESKIQLVGFALFILLAIVLTYKDITRMFFGG